MLKLSLVVVLALCIVVFAALDLQDPEVTLFQNLVGALMFLVDCLYRQALKALYL